ncbi:MAG TPA: hypothetical protein VGN95_13975 [Pyrinomonadaceae bacterium]|nr:hypothetical protein [Pyrinomonadaceae bacterium]
MKIVHAPLKRQNRLAALCNALALLLLLSISVAAQSTDMEYPTLVRSNELSGTIVPRDLGDPRLTRYFYSFTGTPGDLIVAVESKNLEGDVDVFTASTLRPLAKVSMYAGGTTSNGSKTIYLKTREPLILRVEARTPNDDEGSFRIRFDGAFEPISSDVPDREPVVPTVSSASNGRRVTATGARIDEPEPAAATTQPEIETPTMPKTETPAPAETTTARATTPAPPRPRTPRTRRTRTPIPRTTRTRPSPTARRTPTPVEPAPAVEPASGPRLIIEMRDGMRVERYMTTVRRVTVENGQIVVITKDGKVDRQPMSNVLRMAIEP